jgi:AraC family transcriptional regulator, transcriptional activator of the genes for pyochelin and ferripyochelin receptors
MDLSITASDGSSLKFEAGVPPSLQNYVLPGVPSVSATAPFGKMIFHEMKGGGFTLVYSHYICDHDVTLEARMDAPVLEFQLACKNTVHFTRTGLGEVFMLEKQFNLFYTPFWETSCTLEAGREYTTLAITFDVAYLEKLAPHFPFLDLFLQQAKQGNPAMLSEFYNYANIQMMGIAHDILYGDFSEHVKNLYVEAKVIELLIQALDKVGHFHSNMAARIVLRPYDIERIKEAAELLIQNMDNPLTIVELAHRVGLNDYKLKKGFKQVYGTTIFNYFMGARMERAKSLLEDTSIPVMDIAYMTGYRNISNFITAFRKNFGGSPGSLRKR